MYNFKHMKEVDMKAGEYIKLKRKEKKLSLRQVAYKTGLSHTYISDIEKGNLIGTNETHEKIISGLNFSEEEKNFFYNLLLEDQTLPKYLNEKIKKSEAEIKNLKNENEELKKQIIIKNNSNNGDIVVGNNEKNYINSDIDLSGLDEADIQQIKTYIAFIKAQKMQK